MTVRGYAQPAWPDKQLFDLTRCYHTTIRFSNRRDAYHDLVADRIAGGEEGDAMLLRECLNLLILLKVGLALVLNVVIECENHLPRVLDLSGAHGHELLRDGPGVVVRHTSVGLYLYVVAAPNELSLRETDSMALHDLFRQGLWCLVLNWGICERELRPLVM
jgi:hypothetical protein